MKHIKTLAALSLLAVGATSYADFQQPWDGIRSPFVSIVQSCNNPIPAPLLASDDYLLPDNHNIQHIKWWGVVSDPAQLARPYRITLRTNFMGQPNALLFQTCTVPTQTALVGQDCQGNDVYSFYVQLPMAFANAAGHYWFSVSEIDSGSVNAGVSDFWWSGRRPVRGAQAGQRNAMGGWITPLVDACDQASDDLAFCLG